MGASRRREEEKVCPLCIEVLDATEKSFFPCPCGYQVCLFCFDRLKNDCGNLCPGCRTEYGSANNPFAKRKANGGIPAEAPASASSGCSSPVAAPPSAAATTPEATVAAGDAGMTPGLTPLQQARQMHQAKLVAAQQAASQQQAATQQSKSSAAPSHLQAAQCLESAAPPPLAPPTAQLQHQHQQPRRSGTAFHPHSETIDSPRRRHQHQHSQPQALAQQQAVQQTPPPQLSLPSLHDRTLRLQTSLGSIQPGWVQDQPLVPPPHSSRGPGISSSASMALDMPLSALPQQQPGQWLAPGSAIAFSGAAAPAPATANDMQATSGLFADANGTAANPWGGDMGGKSAFAQPQRRTAVPLRSLPLDGEPEVEAEPGAEEDLAAARLAVQCGQMSASDAAWKLLSASASVRAV